MTMKYLSDFKSSHLEKKLTWNLSGHRSRSHNLKSLSHNSINKAIPYIHTISPYNFKIVLLPTLDWEPCHFDKDISIQEFSWPLIFSLPFLYQKWSKATPLAYIEWKTIVWSLKNNSLNFSPMINMFVFFTIFLFFLQKYTILGYFSPFHYQTLHISKLRSFQSIQHVPQHTSRTLNHQNRSTM